MPSLEQLTLYFPREAVLRIPDGAPLRIFELRRGQMTHEQLRRDITRVFSFAMGMSYDEQQLIYALTHDPQGAPSLELTLNNSLKLYLQHPDGRTREFAFFDVSFPGLQMLLHISSVFNSAQHLVLHSSLAFAEDGATRVFSARLPALRKLGVRHGGVVYHKLTYVGPLLAPALARLELLAGARTVARVDVAHIVIEGILELADRSRLELFIDTANGVILEGDVDRLWACVGRVLE